MEMGFHSIAFGKLLLLALGTYCVFGIGIDIIAYKRGVGVTKRRFVVALAMVALLAGCETHKYRTEEQMLKAAHKVYEDYLFEYGIDSALFASPKIETLQNGNRSYTWIARGSDGIPVGIEVIVTRIKGTKPQMVLIGDADAWFPLVGSKNKK